MQVIINNANATSSANIAKNIATMESYYTVIKTEAEAYANLKTGLGMNST